MLIEKVRYELTQPIITSKAQIESRDGWVVALDEGEYTGCGEILPPLFATERTKLAAASVHSFCNSGDGLLSERGWMNMPRKKGAPDQALKHLCTRSKSNSLY